MKMVVGFSFTDYPVQYLIEMGFLFQCNEFNRERGYRECLCTFLPHLGSGLSIEIREILEEDVYTQFHKQKNFSPFEYENTTFPTDKIIQQHPNSVYCVQGILTEDMEPGELKDYFKYKKPYPLWALWLKCKDINNFSTVLKSEKTFLWQKKKAILLHLGQSCFDLLITT